MAYVKTPYAAEKIGREIKMQREARGWSQNRLADRAQTGQATIALIEKGRANPSLELLERIAKAMHQDLVVALRRKLGN